MDKSITLESRIDLGFNKTFYHPFREERRVGTFGICCPSPALHRSRPRTTTTGHGAFAETLDRGLRTLRLFSASEKLRDRGRAAQAPTSVRPQQADLAGKLGVRPRVRWDDRVRPNADCSSRRLRSHPRVRVSMIAYSPLALQQKDSGSARRPGGDPTAKDERGSGGSKGVAAQHL